jgi:hypothetical protein
MDFIAPVMSGSVKLMFKTSDMTEKVGRERAELRESEFRFSVVSYVSYKVRVINWWPLLNARGSDYIQESGNENQESR